MDYLFVCAVAVLVAALTLFSGFGLGTLLMPAFALFFPVPVAVAATAVVHLANNALKVFLVGRHADRTALLRFAGPAVLAAFAGAFALNALGGLPPVTAYSLGGHRYQITLVKLVIGLLVLGFAILDLAPGLQRLTVDRKYLPLGGALSGFFGGLSGHQGALRATFLIKAGLSKEAFIGTGVLTAVLVDLARLPVYGVGFYTTAFASASQLGWLVLGATLSAFAGSFLGARLLPKLTVRGLQIMVGLLVMAVGLGLAAALL